MVPCLCTPTNIVGVFCFKGERLMKKTVSVKNTIGIREYMNYYLEVPYLNDERLTHDKMKDYLEEKGYPVPRSIAFSKITTEDVVRGNYLLVREETKKSQSSKDSFKKARILAYQNPLRENLNFLLTNENLTNEGVQVKVYSKTDALYYNRKG